MLSPDLCDAIEAESGRIGTFGHGYTYTGHPVCAAVALKTIELYQERDIVGACAPGGAAFPEAPRAAWASIRWWAKRRASA